MLTIASVAGLDHVRDRPAAQPHRRGEVHPQARLPRAGGQLGDRPVGLVDDVRDRVVDQDRQAAERRDRGVDQVGRTRPRRRGRQRGTPHGHRASRISRTTASPRPLVATVHRRRARLRPRSARTIARPMPDVDPVTSASSPASRIYSAHAGRARCPAGRCRSRGRVAVERLGRGLGAALPKSRSCMPSIGTTWTCTCGTSRPAIISPTRTGSNACCWARRDLLGHAHQVGVDVGVEVDPVVDLGAGHDEQCARA